MANPGRKAGGWEVVVASPTTLHLFWNGQPLGQITEAGWSDFPWAHGKFSPGDWPADLRVAIEWLAKSEETCAEPPFVDMEQFLDGWTVVDLKGAARDIGPPIVDFAAGEIEWR